MKKLMIVWFFLFGFTFSSGCSDVDSNDAAITEEEAKQLVLTEHERDDNDIEVVSIIEEGDKFIVKWEIEPIRKGKDSVHKQTGDLQEIESSTGTCKWR